MERLKESFRLNDLQYTLLKRNDVVALYRLSGTYTDKIVHYEVCKIHIRKADEYSNFDRESVPNNELFGRDGSRCFNDRDTAEYYFDRLTKKLNLVRGGQKAISGVEEDVEVIPDYQLA